jgi:hypothetical protein
MARRQGADAIIGLWAIYGPAGNRECYNLEIQPDLNRGRGLFADIWYWTAGDLGCDTCSSGIVQNDLGSVTPAASPVTLTGSIGFTDGTRADLRINMTVTSDRTAEGTLLDGKGHRTVTFKRVETPPLYVIAKEG